MYLGETIHSQGLEAGIEATIDSRLGKVRGAMFKAKALMEDYKLQAIAGMEGAWILWEKAILPTLLAGCGGWIGASKKIYEKLDSIQNEYLRMIYSCPPSMPKPALRSQTGMTSMKHKIWVEKLCVITRIMNPLEDKENYAKQILDEQQEQGWKGITTEVEEICLLVGLPNVCKKFVSRVEVVKAIELHHLKEIKLEMEPLSKLSKIKNTDTRSMQQYMKQKCLEDSRTEFVWETNMIDTRMNMKGRYKKG